MWNITYRALSKMRAWFLSITSTISSFEEKVISFLSTATAEIVSAFATGNIVSYFSRCLNNCFGTKIERGGGNYFVFYFKMYIKQYAKNNWLTGFFCFRMRFHNFGRISLWKGPWMYFLIYIILKKWNREQNKPYSLQ